MKTSSTLKSIILILGDLALFSAAIAATVTLRYPSEEWVGLLSRHLIPFALISTLWIIIHGAFGLYDLRLAKNSKQLFYRILHAMAVNVAVSIAFFYLIPVFNIEPRRNLFLIAFFAVLLLTAWRSFFNLFAGRAGTSRILFFGVSPDALELADYLLKNPQLGYRPTAFMSTDDEDIPDTLPLPFFNNHRDLPHIVKDMTLDTIVILPRIKENKTFVRILFQVIPLGVAVREFSAFHEMLTGKIPSSLIGEVWFLENLVGVKNPRYEFFKRMIDIVTAGLLFVPLLFLLPIVALAIKLDSEGPVFFRQRRMGRDGKIFSLTKFRSMIKDAESIGGLKGEGVDTRHTRVGSWLRRTYLDELPQIVNILRGEMSFVGPRPERPEYGEELKQKIPFYEMRLLVPPGITGWAQVNMQNDASVEDAPEKMQYDLYYVKNRSPILDLLIVICTIFTILRRRGR